MTAAPRDDPFRDDEAPRPVAGVETIELDDELVLFDPATGALHALDPLASLIWRCLDGTGTVAELVADLADAFGTDAATVRHDVDALLTMLAANGVLESADRPAARPEAIDADGEAGPRVLADPPDP